MSSVVLKVKDSFTKATNKGLKCDIIYLSKQDYNDFCSDLKMEGISEIDINGIKLTIVKIDGKDKSHLHVNNAVPKKTKKNEDKESVDKYYI
jgi:hypothetical protein